MNKLTIRSVIVSDSYGGTLVEVDTYGYKVVTGTLVWDSEFYRELNSPEFRERIRKIIVES